MMNPPSNHQNQPDDANHQDKPDDANHQDKPDDPSHQNQPVDNRLPGVQEAWHRLSVVARWTPYTAEDVDAAINILKPDLLEDVIPLDRRDALFEKLKTYTYLYCIQEGTFICLAHENPGGVGSESTVNPDGRLKALQSCLESHLALWSHLGDTCLPKSEERPPLRRDQEIKLMLENTVLENLKILGEHLGFSPEQCLEEIVLSYIIPRIEPPESALSNLKTITEKAGLEFKETDVVISRPRPLVESLYAQGDLTPQDLYPEKTLILIRFSKTELEYLKDTADSHDLTPIAYLSSLANEYFLRD